MSTIHYLFFIFQYRMLSSKWRAGLEFDFTILCYTIVSNQSAFSQHGKNIPWPFLISLCLNPDSFFQTFGYLSSMKGDFLLNFASEYTLFV